MIRERSDLHFLFLTKRIERFMDCIPMNWNDGYDNATVGNTVENQDRADYRLFGSVGQILSETEKAILYLPVIYVAKQEKRISITKIITSLFCAEIERKKTES